ncbi:DUF2194 domain-containing protein [Maribacter sp. 2-571]|uniref:DUF2194 domain-containing protein n=1 Tax=Maribacter sp. 2-571 TaxID=3417569 RepID=UPI003D34D618
MSLKHAISLLLLVLGLVGCQRDIYNFTQQFNTPEVSREPAIIQFIVDETSPENRDEMANVRKLADYTKLPFGTVPLKTFAKEFQVGGTTRVLCVSQTLGMEDKVIDSLQNFVAKGGTLFFTKTIKDERLAFLLGLDPASNFETDSTAFGFRFNRPMLPGLQNFNYEGDKSPHLGLSRYNFTDDTTVFAGGSDNAEYPLIIERQLGKGKVVQYNSTLRMDKAMRGLLFAQVLLGLEGVPYPVANTATIFLDDFPSPLYNIYKEPIALEMKKTVAQYVTDIWWPDMKQYAKEQDIAYTAYVTFDYNTLVTPPFTFKEWDKNSFEKQGMLQEKSSWLGRDVYASGHELGFHGYNHVSLLASDWEEPQYMVTGLHAAAKKWKTLDFKELPVSYVPPSNYIDSVGLAKLKAGMPSIKYIQSIYFGEIEEGGGREFDPDPLNDQFFDFPRITSGYEIDKNGLWAMESLYLFTGIWTHFVHPDDVFQIPDESNEATSGHFAYRNPNSLNWRSRNGTKGLFDRFKEHIADFKERHPLVRFQNATTSSDMVRNWRYAYFTHTRENGEYVVSGENLTGQKDGHYWFMYGDRENENLIDNSLAEVSHVGKTPFLNGFLYTIETPEAFLKVPDLQAKKRKPGISDENMVLETWRAKKQFDLDRSILAPFNQELTHLIAENKLKEATNLIAVKLNSGIRLNTRQWLDYVQYLSWQEQGNLIWEMLEKAYQKNGSERLADISWKVSKTVDYPDAVTREKWLTRQVMADTENQEVLDSYVAYFNTPERKKLVLKALRKLKKIAPNQNNTKNYIEHLMGNDFEQLLPELNTISPCDPLYSEMATAIAWAYADNFRYDKALQWEKCSGEIDPETKNGWLVNTKDFDRLKRTDFDFYLQLLLANDTERAIREIRNEPVCAPELKKHATGIAYAYADYKLYREALAWGACSNGEVPITSKLSWRYELKEYGEVEKMYADHMAIHPEDYSAQLHMATLRLYRGDVNGAAAISAALPKNMDQGKLRNIINAKAEELNSVQKRGLLQRSGEVLYSGVRKNLYSALRMEEGNSVSTNSYAINDQLDPNTISNTVSYNLYDSHFNVHSISGTQSFMYPINFIPESDTNGTRNLYGLEYRVRQHTTDGAAWSGRARIERDDLNELYYQLGVAVNFNAEKRFSSLGLEHFPVRTGPGHILNIYRTQLASYNELLIAPKTKQILSLEANHYTDSEADLTVLGRSEYELFQNEVFRLSPLIELAYTAGTVDRRDGFPYWTARNRMYGGGGVAVGLGSEKTAFQMNADLSIFAESGEPNFERYTGTISYKIKDFARITGGYEFYTIDNFNSNVFQLGLSYNFR